MRTLELVLQHLNGGHGGQRAPHTTPHATLRLLRRRQATSLKRCRAVTLRAARPPAPRLGITCAPHLPAAPRADVAEGMDLPPALDDAFFSSLAKRATQYREPIANDISQVRDHYVLSAARRAR